MPIPPGEIIAMYNTTRALAPGEFVRFDPRPFNGRDFYSFKHDEIDDAYCVVTDFNLQIIRGRGKGIP